MFTGIVEATGTIRRIEMNGTNKTFWIESPLSALLKIDQSLAHNGVCLTVEAIESSLHQVTAVQETLAKTTLSDWKENELVNLERSLLPSSRLDGHFVQGHVDSIGYLKKIKDVKGSYELEFKFSKKYACLIIEKGSVSLNGISLTVYDVEKDKFKVSIIPYTWENTNLKHLREKQEVNLEFDLIGKYINRNLSLKG